MVDDERFSKLLRYVEDKDLCRAVKLWLSEEHSNLSFGAVLWSSDEGRLHKLIEVACQNNLADLLAIILKLSFQPASNRINNRVIKNWMRFSLKCHAEGAETVLQTFFPAEYAEFKATHALEINSIFNALSLSGLKRLFVYYTEYLPVSSFLVSMCLALAFSSLYAHLGLDQSLFVHGFNILGQILVWISFWLLWRTDPGYLVSGCDLASYTKLLSGLEKALSQGILRNSKVYCCHICKFPRPLRAGHSITANKCVRMYDHFCTFLYRDIGKNNYVYFLSYLFNMSVVCIPQYLRLAALFLRQRMLTPDYDTSWLLFVCKAFMVWTFMIWLFISYLLVFHLYLSYLGLTSRELKYGVVQFPYISDSRMLKKASEKDIYLQDMLAKAASE